MNSLQNNELYEFAGFCLDANKRSLTRGDAVVQLTPKEFDVLLMLVRNRSRAVAKDELLGAVWKNTFVEEATLTRNISWLRQKLCKHAADTKFIETVPKCGYRFLPEVARAAADSNESIENAVAEFALAANEQTPRFADDETKSKRRAAPRVQTAPQPIRFAARKKNSAFLILWFAPSLLLLVVIALGFTIYRGSLTTPRAASKLPIKTTPFSGLPGRENYPAFSPDNKQIVFAWDGGVENGKLNIYIKFVGAGEAVRLTRGETDDINPIFAGDGESIFFLRVFPDHNEIVQIPALGGAERIVDERASYASVSIAPGNENLALAQLDPAAGATGIYILNLRTNQKTRLTTPEALAVDHTPRFSPDGKWIAFVRYFSSSKREIFVVPATGGAARQITFDDARIHGLAWNANSQDLFFTSFRAIDQLNLWRVSTIAKSAPESIPLAVKNVAHIAVSPNGRTLAAVEESDDENIWEYDIEARRSQPLVRSSRADHSPLFSPDNTKIAFASERTGNYEIWLADHDGKNQRQLTFSNGSAGSPRFSPDGKTIVYDVQIAGGSDVYTIPVNGGAPLRLTENQGNNLLPDWSRDGNTIFFISDRAGDNTQIWRMPATGGAAAQITKHGAFELRAAFDGERIFYSTAPNKIGLWSVAVDGANENPVPELAEVGAWRSWSIAPNGIYYTAFAAEAPLKIIFYDFAERKPRDVVKVNKLPLLYYSNLSVSSDNKKILYAQQDRPNSNITLADLSE